MLYTSDATGDRQLHLAPFPPDPNRDWTVATLGRTDWSVNGPGGGSWFDEERDRVLFVNEGPDSIPDAGRWIWSVSFTHDPDVQLGRPEPLLALPKDLRISDFDAANLRFLGTANEQPTRIEVRLLRGWRED